MQNNQIPLPLIFCTAPDQVPHFAPVVDRQIGESDYGKKQCEMSRKVQSFADKPLKTLLMPLA